MSDHSKTLIPLETWCYHSPDLKYIGKSTDIGLLAEALIYYDQVLIDPGYLLNFIDLINWFIKQDKYDLFLSLIKDDIIKIYNFAFFTNSVEKDGEYTLWNINSPEQAEPNSFLRRYLYDEQINQCIPNRRDRIKIYKAFENRVVEAHPQSFNLAIENAREDFKNPKRSALLVQVLVDELFPLLKLGQPPEINVKICNKGTQTQIIYNINFDHLSQLIGKNIDFNKGTPLTGEGHCNRLLWSAAQLNCDLFLGKPMSRLAGDKLYETGFKTTKIKNMIESLNIKVEFPDIRSLVNSDKLNIDDILFFRKKARKFREWLNEEGERDRDAIIAYHNEFSKENNLEKFGGKTLSIFGRFGGPALGGFIGYSLGNAEGAVLGAVLGEAPSFIIELATKLNDWKPVVFGNWLSNRIEKMLDDE